MSEDYHVMPDDNCLALKQLMSKIPEGKIEDQAVSSEIEAALYGAWHSLDRAPVGGMRPDKLLGYLAAWRESNGNLQY